MRPGKDSSRDIDDFEKIHQIVNLEAYDVHERSSILKSIFHYVFKGTYPVTNASTNRSFLSLKITVIGLALWHIQLLHSSREYTAEILLGKLYCKYVL